LLAVIGLNLDIQKNHHLAQVNTIIVGNMPRLPVMRMQS